MAASSTFAGTSPSFSDARRREKLARGYADVDAIVRAFIEAEHVPGGAWGVVIDGELAHAGTAGSRDLAARAPVDVGTSFRIASMTKSFTALAILKLRDEGRLSLDDPAERYLPELRALAYPTSDSSAITVRHLLSHAAGLPEDDEWADRRLADTDEQFSRLLRRGLPFSQAPGVAYEYSNTGFAILGRVVSNVSDVPYEDYVEANVLRPLGMTHTGFDPGGIPALARGYRWEDSRWKEEPSLGTGAFGPMGGIITTLPDLARYVALFLDAWPPRDGVETAPIRRASLREMQQVWRTAPATIRRAANGAVRFSAGGYGFGLCVAQTSSFTHVVSHAGGLPGFGSEMRWLPEHGVGLIALGNLRYAPWNATLDSAMEALLATGGLQPRVVRPSLALAAVRDAVSRLVMAWDDALADEIAAENLFADSDKSHRRGEIERLRAIVGALAPGAGFDRIHGALRGEWTMPGERGALKVAVSLAPTSPPKVQSLSVRLS